MTPIEIERAIESKRRVERVRAQERATYDYILANLIGKSIARIYSSSATMPDIATVYPSLFNDEQIKQQQAEQKAKLTALRFKQFAQYHNKKFK